MKIFVGDSLAGNDTVNQAREFFQYTNFDGSILTKSDADAKGGAAISIAYLTHKPILYLGVGQGYGDLAEFNHNKFLDSIFKDRVYDKTNDDLKSKETSLSDTKLVKHVTEIPNVDSQADSKPESTSKDVDKFKTNNESVSTPPTVELERKDLDNEVRLVPDQVYDEQMRKNEETNEETSKTKSKKRSFFDNFSRDRKNEDAIIDGKSPSNKDIKTKKDKSKKGTENEKEEVVYLTDDDINDLIK
jgi:fused signal recognition particle receptor